MNNVQNQARYWLSPTQRALRMHPTATIAPATRRPFSKPKTAPQSGAESTLKTAQIFLFTGSNTPYQSHE
jgi:hypothetical protein